MLELGPESANLHRQAGRAAAALGLDCIVAVQGDAAEIVNGAIGAGMPASQRALLRRFFRRRGVSCGFREAGRSAAGERIARSEDGAHRRSAAGEVSAGGGSGTGAGADYQLRCSTTSSTTSPPRRRTCSTSFATSPCAPRSPASRRLFLGLILGPWMIRRLRQLQIGQFIREEGPQLHQAKAGTPTMGGILIVTVTLAPTLFWADLSNAYVLLAIFAMLAFGAIGFADDLQQSCAPPQSGPHRPVEDPLPDPGELRGGAGAAFDDHQRQLLHAADRAVLQEFSARPGGAFAFAKPLFLAGGVSALSGFRDPGDGGLVERGESDRRPGWLGHRLRGGGCGRA